MGEILLCLGITLPYDPMEEQIYSQIKAEWAIHRYVYQNFMFWYTPFIIWYCHVTTIYVLYSL